jgi:hypothetical protein
MNDKGRLNILVIILGLITIGVISLGFLGLSARASNGAMPDTHTLQADPGEKGPNQPANPEPAPPAEPPAEAAPSAPAETQPATPGAVEQPAKEAHELIIEEREDGVKDVIPPSQELGKTHRDQTPRELSSLGIYYKDMEGSAVADMTQKILNVNLPEAMYRKNMAAREFQTPDNPEGRLDPLYATDYIPDALRPELEGEGISGAVDSGLIDQLIQNQISTIFKYIPINIIGTMQNGPYKSALVSIPQMGYYGIMSEGQGFQLMAFASEQGFYIINITMSTISEDEVTMTMSATVVDPVYYRPVASTAPVTRHFYIRRYN